MLIHDKTVYAAILIFITLGCGYSFFTPLWVPPSESTVFSYCEYIARNKELPGFGKNFSDTAPRITQAFHPPLYFFLCSLFIDPNAAPLQETVTVNDGPGHIIIEHPAGDLRFPFSSTVRTAYLLRLFTLFLSSLTIYGIYAIVLCLFPGCPSVAVVAAVLAATNPQFLHVAGSISNEGPAAAFVTMFLFLMLRQMLGKPSLVESIISGLVMGAALLTKSSSLLVFPLTVGLFLVLALDKCANSLRNGIAVMLTGIAVSGWWYAYNWSTFLTMDTGLSWYVRSVPLTVDYIANVIVVTYTSFLGFFGALQVPLPHWQLSVYGFLGLLGFIGMCKTLFSKKFSFRTVKSGTFLLCAFVLFAVIYIVLNRKFYACEGKYFFVVIGPIAAFFGCGLISLVPQRQKKNAAIFLCLLLIVLSTDVLFGVLKPAFSPPRVSAAVTQQEFSRRTEPLSRSGLGQTFLCPSPGLCGVRILADVGQQACCSNVVFVLQDEKKGSQLCRIRMPIQRISDTAWYYFAFPPIPSSKGMQYRFTFLCESSCAPANIALWYTLSEVYSAGSLYINGNPGAGALYFEAYCFRGDKPRTVWEGISAVGIKQRQYIDVVELERFLELQEHSRMQSSTAVKIRKYEKALSYERIQ